MTTLRIDNTTFKYFNENGNVINEKNEQGKQDTTYTFDEQGRMLTERTESGSGASTLVRQQTESK
jgi:YD repeat-containing protein